MGGSDPLIMQADIFRVAEENMIYYEKYPIHNVNKYNSEKKRRRTNIMLNLEWLEILTSE